MPSLKVVQLPGFKRDIVLSLNILRVCFLNRQELSTQTSHAEKMFRPAQAIGRSLDTYYTSNGIMNRSQIAWCQPLVGLVSATSLCSHATTWLESQDTNPFFKTLSNSCAWSGCCVCGLGLGLQRLGLL